MYIRINIGGIFLSTFFKSLQIAAVYIGTVIGAGFATGKEIVEFFTQYGDAGLIGIIISGILFIWLGTKMMVMARRLHIRTYEQFNAYLFGKKISVVINIVMTIVIFGVTSVMFSGAGAMFEEVGMPSQFGILFTMCLAFVVAIFGVRGLFSINLLIVPMMVIFSFLIAWSVMTLDYGSFSVHVEGKSIISAVSYTAFNLMLAQAVLVPLAHDVDEEKAIWLGGIIGGIMLSLTLISSHLALAILPNISEIHVPMVEVIKTVFASLYGLYVIVIYGEIFTTVIGNLYGLGRQLQQFFIFPMWKIVLVMLVLLYPLSLLGYGMLLSLLYPIFGYMSVGFLLFLIIRRMPRG